MRHDSRALLKKNHNAFKSELQGLSHVQSTLHGDAIANIIHNFRMLSVTSAGNSPFRLRFHSATTCIRNSDNISAVCNSFMALV